MTREEAVEYLENMKKDDEKKFNRFINQCRWLGVPDKEPSADHMVLLVGWHYHEYGVLE